MSSQTTEFVDAKAGEVLDFKTSVTKVQPPDNQPTLGLAEFLARPTMIYRATWLTSAFTTTSFDPWFEFLNTTAIKNKLANFAFLRGDLKVKIVVNCSPFYYGALMAYYNPINSTPLASTAVDYVTISQRPHIWIYPQTSTGGEMNLPFFYHKNYLPLQSASDAKSLGTITFKQYTALTSANGATSNGCTIAVYAWMENAQLQGNTSFNIMQSGKVKDEYGNGPVSAPAAALSNWARHLRDTPIIGKYATATQIGASAVSKIAMLFGWTNVPVIEDVRPMKNLPFHDLASAHISEPVSKMTLDPKAEISVDPTIVGLNNADEMAISNLVQHESFLTSSTWYSSDSYGAQYFVARVTPLMYDRGSQSANGTYGIAMTPMCHVARAFSHWRGDIIFRFKIICSRFHQGRLKICWDPLGANSGPADLSHIVLTKIVDLAESDEVEFRVPYMQAAQWSNVVGVIGDIYSANNWVNGGSNFLHYNDCSNGCITVKCLTNLSAPIDSASVTILTFVRAADNFMLANPKDLLSSCSYLQMQSGTADAETGVISDEFHKTNFGDPVLSLRTLLRRSVLHDVRRLEVNSPHSTRITCVQGRVPIQPGYDTYGNNFAKGVEAPANSYRFNFTRMTPLTWFLPAFVAHRGSTRWHFNVSSAIDGVGTVDVPALEVGRNTYTAVSTLNQMGISTASTTQDHWKQIFPHGSSGLVLTNQKTQTGVSVEMPMNTQYKFVYSLPSTSLIGRNEDGSYADTYTMSMVQNGGNVNMKHDMFRYVSIGTDFNMHFFLSVPVLYYNTNMGLTPG